MPELHANERGRGAEKKRLTTPEHSTAELHAKNRGKRKRLTTPEQSDADSHANVRGRGARKQRLTTTEHTTAELHARERGRGAKVKRATIPRLVIATNDYIAIPRLPNGIGTQSPVPRDVERTRQEKALRICRIRLFMTWAMGWTDVVVCLLFIMSSVANVSRGLYQGCLLQTSE